MQFKLTNMGRIGTADVTLNGITVIAGPNGSGKSTISRALFTWFNYLRQVREDVRKEREIGFRNDFEMILQKAGVPMLTTLVPIEYPKEILNLSFWNDEQKSHEWVCETILRRLPSYGWFVPQEDEQKVKEKALSLSAKVYVGVKERALYWINKDEDEIALFDLLRYFHRAFDGQIGTYFDEQAKTTVTLESDKAIVRSCSFCNGKEATLMDACTVQCDTFEGMQMFYLEPVHFLDKIPPVQPTANLPVLRRSDNRYSVESAQQWETILHGEYGEYESFAKQETMIPLFRELDKIVSTIHGEIVRDETKLTFKDADLPGDKAVSLMNIASGAKSMAAIVRGLRNDSIHPGDFIIIDEPESNLHPEWQVQFAKFLVLLHAKFDIRFLLNTHSPDFLKAIEVYSDLLEQQADCSYYNMVSETGRQYNTKCVNENREEIFERLGNPFIRLMHGEHYEQPIS